MVLSFSGDDRDEVESYASGPRASIFKPDGSGFIYYPSGRVAVCKGIIDSRGRYYLYGDDPRSTPLGAVNEHAVGFFLGQGGIRLGLNKVGKRFNYSHGYISMGRELWGMKIFFFLLSRLLIDRCCAFVNRLLAF